MDETQVNDKPWWQSRTMWFNALLGIGMAVEGQLALIHPFLGEKTYAAFAIGLLSGNAVLRVITSMGLRL